MIPKTIYRSWKTQNFHPKIQKQMDKMLKLNSEYKQVIYTDEQIFDYVKSNYDSETFKAFERLNIMTARVDFWRYLILYKQGGIYLDIDSQINTKISNFLNEEDDCLITAETNPELFVQWGLFFDKKHPILEKTISNVTKNIITNKYPNDIVNTTGPGVFTESLQEIHLKYHNETLDWKIINPRFDQKYLIVHNNDKYNYRIFGVDFNKNLSFKYKDTSYLYQNAKHWKVEESMKELIEGN
jgi:mannosyltransferase OCH1-like enzyme